MAGLLDPVEGLFFGPVRAAEPRPVKLGVLIGADPEIPCLQCPRLDSELLLGLAVPLGEPLGQNLGYDRKQSEREQDRVAPPGKVDIK